MSKGLGKQQRVALEMVADGITIIMPHDLAFKLAGGAPTVSQLSAACRSLKSLCEKGLIADHGFSKGTGRKCYGMESAGRIREQIETLRSLHSGM